VLTSRENSPRVWQILTLTAAIALGLAWARLNIINRMDPRTDPRLAFSELTRTEMLWLYADSYAAVPVLVMVCGLMLAARSNPGTIGLLLTTPGVVACFGTTVALGAECGWALIRTVKGIIGHGFQLEYRHHYYRFIWWQSLIPVIRPAEISLAIVVCWLVHALRDGWRPSAFWVDRLGRLIGVFWVAWTIVAEILR
jgi:hypothetical protein